MVREMDVHRLQGSGKCIKVAIHSAPPSSEAAGYYSPSSLISIPNQYSSAAVKRGVNQGAEREIGHTGGGGIKRRLLMRCYKSAGSVGALYRDAAAE